MLLVNMCVVCHKPSIGLFYLDLLDILCFLADSLKVTFHGWFLFLDWAAAANEFPISIVFYRITCQFEFN